MSRSTVPRSSASRLAGVTRSRSITPESSSQMTGQPAPIPAPNAISTMIPGTNTSSTCPGGNAGPPASDRSSGANSARYSTGVVSPVMIQTGWRSVSSSLRRKNSPVCSRRTRSCRHLLARRRSRAPPGDGGPRRAATGRSPAGTRRQASAARPTRPASGRPATPARRRPLPSPAWRRWPSAGSSRARRPGTRRTGSSASSRATASSTAGDASGVTAIVSAEYRCLSSSGRPSAMTRP